MLKPLPITQIRPPLHPIHVFLFATLMALLVCGTLKADPSPIGTGLLSNITLGALQNSGVINRTRVWDESDFGRAEGRDFSTASKKPTSKTDFRERINLELKKASEA